MSLLIDKLTIKNFLSVGNNEQEISMNSNLMTLLVGINKDKDSEGSSNGSGKAQPLDAKIALPNGKWTTMGEIKIGDEILGSDLSPINVDGIFPQGKKSVYKIEFRDGRSTEATKDHLWEIKKRNGIKSENKDIVTTADLIELLKNNVHVEMECGSTDVLFNDITLPYSVETLGKFISLETISEIPDEFMEMSFMQFTDFYLSLSKESGFEINDKIITTSIPTSALPKFKFLAIKYGVSVEERIVLGNISIISIRQDGMISLKSIKYVGVKECQCIHVNSEDHLYITDDYIVTHNTTCINALSYAIYGEPLSEIKKDNLVNKTNIKNMEVILEFYKDSVKYVIHRGRKPNILKFYVNNEEYNESRASVRDTQSEIEYVFGMSYEMFKTIVVLDSTNVPFLSLKDKDRKPIIEELLGITILSKKAEVLKLQLKDIKSQIKNEEMKIDLKISNNERIRENIKNLHVRKDLWEKNHSQKILEIKDQYDEISKIDIVSEIENHTKYKEYTDSVNELTQLTDAFDSITTEKHKIENEINRNNILLEEAKNHKCPECKQDIHSEVYQNVVKNIESNISDLQNKLDELEGDKILLEDAILKKADENSNISCPHLIYKNVHDAYSHATRQHSIEKDLSFELEKENPFIDQIKNLEESSLENISYDNINILTDKENHMNFLYKLLTNSDSFIRKNIIEQNLKFLNKRLTFYSEQLMLLQQIKFNSDLSISISKSGDEFDFSQLSTGEKTRVTISLSLAFRDVWERLNTSINIWFFDEIIDSGMDQQGIQDAIKLLEQFVVERNKDVFLISHKLDLAANIENVLYAIMEDGFTSYSK